AAETARSAAAREQSDIREKRRALGARLDKLQQASALASDTARRLREARAPAAPARRPSADLQVYRVVEVVRRCRVRRLAEGRARLERAIAAARAAALWKAEALAREGLARLELKSKNVEAAAAQAVGALAASLRDRDAASAGVDVELLVQAVGVEAAVARA